jgi:hypothetical protein
MFRRPDGRLAQHERALVRGGWGGEGVSSHKLVNLVAIEDSIRQLDRRLEKYKKYIPIENITNSQLPALRIATWSSLAPQSADNVGSSHLRMERGDRPPQSSEVRMDEEIRLVHEHMLSLGLGALAHSNWHANYQSMENDQWSELSVIQAAHAAEILIKARIAQEHPLLIFEQLPKPTGNEPSKLRLKDLIENGRTYQYADLPVRLWATTGIRIPNLEMYRSFGRLRNAIQHFASPGDRDVSQDAIEFTFGVIDPLINACWGLFAVDYNEDYEPYEYFVPGLIRRGVRFLVSPDMIQDIGTMTFEWPEGDATYRVEMEKRIDIARRKAE